MSNIITIRLTRGAWATIRPAGAPKWNRRRHFRASDSDALGSGHCQWLGLLGTTAWNRSWGQKYSQRTKYKSSCLHHKSCLGILDLDNHSYSLWRQLTSSMSSQRSGMNLQWQQEVLEWKCLLRYSILTSFLPPRPSCRLTQPPLALLPCIPFALPFEEKLPCQLLLAQLRATYNSAKSRVSKAWSIPPTDRSET